MKRISDEFAASDVGDAMHAAIAHLLQMTDLHGAPSGVLAAETSASTEQLGARLLDGLCENGAIAHDSRGAPYVEGCSAHTRFLLSSTDEGTTRCVAIIGPAQNSRLLGIGINVASYTDLQPSNVLSTVIQTQLSDEELHQISRMPADNCTKWVTAFISARESAIKALADPVRLHEVTYGRIKIRADVTDMHTLGTHNDTGHVIGSGETSAVLELAGVVHIPFCCVMTDSFVATCAFALGN